MPGKIEYFYDDGSHNLSKFLSSPKGIKLTKLNRIKGIMRFNLTILCVFLRKISLHLNFCVEVTSSGFWDIGRLLEIYCCEDGFQ